MRLRPLLVVVATSVSVAACGGSSHSSTATATGTPAASSRTSTSPPKEIPGTIKMTVSGVATITTTTSTSAPPEVPKAKKQKHHGSSHAASQGAHVKTHLAVSANGDISPPVVSVPSGVGVEVHVTNHSSAADTVTLSVPGHPSVHVGPGASATLQTGGLKDGTYRILINGTARGQLMIGAQGGP